MPVLTSRRAQKVFTGPCHRATPSGDSETAAASAEGTTCIGGVPIKTNPKMSGRGSLTTDATVTAVAASTEGTAAVRLRGTPTVGEDAVEVDGA